MKRHLTTILIVTVSVLVTVLVMTLFRKAPVSEKMIRDDEKIKHLERDRLQDSVNYVLELKIKTDSISTLQNKFAATTPKLQQSKKEYEKIRPVINSLNDNELLQRANNFRPE